MIMRWSVVVAGLLLCAGVAPADVTAPKPAPPVIAAGHPAQSLSFQSLAAEVDNRVLANLLTDAAPWRKNDMPLSVVAGEINRCRQDSCVVPLTVRVIGAEGPVTLVFAVADPKGELSEIHHAECGTGACSIALVLARGRNAISVGVVDGLAKTSSFTTLRVNANRTYAKTRTQWF